MTRRAGRLAAFATVATMLVAACSSDRQAAESTDTTAATPVTTAAPADSAAGSDTTVAADSADTTAPAPEGETFGDLVWPCGPAEEANTDDGSESGVTADAVSIAAGDDAGYATSPGLNKQMTDAVKALAAKCNELGGIHGRQIKVNYYDAAITNVAQAIQSACDGNNFMLVGEGWAFDDAQEQIRQSCGLPAVPTYTVSAAFAMQPGVFQGVPNPADESPAGVFKHVADLFPEEIKKVATLGGNIAANQETLEKYRRVAPQYGWTFIEDRIEYDIFGGVTDWTPIVKQIQNTGATMLLWSGSCLPNLQKFAQTMKQNGLEIPIITDANNYEAACAAANADGAMDNVYNRFAFVPFEEASENKATQDYLDLLEESGGDTSLLGMQATSSFLLWATAAADCGTTLTRDCVITNLSNVHEWTGGGLHSQTDPGGNHPPTCNVMLKLSGTKYERVVPKEPGTLDCDPSWVGKVDSTPALDALNLDADRHPQAAT